MRAAAGLPNDALLKFSRTFALAFAFFSALCFSLHAEPDDPSFANLFTRQSDSIVTIAAQNRKQAQLGTGFIVNSDGLILTNAHLINNAERVIVKLHDHRGYRRAQVLAVDEKKDLAAIKVNISNLKPVKFGNSNRIKIGERVVTIGNPLGLESTISDGLVSSLRDAGHGQKWLQISVPLSRGSSGGPLFNAHGEVIGITTASLAAGQNLNFAIPINDVKPFLKKAKNVRVAPHRNFLFKHSILRAQDDLASPAQQNYQYYIIQHKDTLYSLARRFDTTVAQIMQLNQLTSSNIYHGQRIKVPVTR